ncbi:hypothetical protein [Microbacterium sp. 22296]|uniref:hypothetical protein n=1 Tax=Microbacterium sp. 22296 TaxID=3453903 RepID=UPI003F85337B
MGELAYMIRADWAQQATAMVPQSKVIRDWVGPAPYLFAVPDLTRFKESTRNLEREVADYIAPEGSERCVHSIANFGELRNTDTVVERCVIVVHPRQREDVETLRELVDDGRLEKVFVLVWWQADEVRTWLDAHGALNLHSGQAASAPDPLMVEAATMIIGEQYNGLSSGYGKDTVVQLVRTFAKEGFALDPEAWLRAYFVAGGDLRHSDSVKKLVKEMRDGVKHRVKPRYVDNIFQHIVARVDAHASTAGTHVS